MQSTSSWSATIACLVHRAPRAQVLALQAVGRRFSQFALLGLPMHRNASQEQADYGRKKASGTEAKCLALFRNVARPLGAWVGNPPSVRLAMKRITALSAAPGTVSVQPWASLNLKLGVCQVLRAERTMPSMQRADD